LKNKRKRDSLAALLTRNYLAFALALLAISGAAYLTWASRMDALTSGGNLEVLTRSSALVRENYDALHRYLSSDEAFAVLDAGGAALYTSDKAFSPALTAGELACVPLYGEYSYLTATPFTAENGRQEYLVAQETYAQDGTADRQRTMLLDAGYRVLSGGLGDGRTAYTQQEYAYLTGALPKGYSLTRYPFQTAGGDSRVLLLRTEPMTMERYRQLSASAWVTPAAFAPLYLAAAAFFVIWLNRRIRRPLQRLDDAIVSLTAGIPASAGTCGGPEEIHRIGESFDRLRTQLEESEAERRRLDEGRQKLLADISHDLRTPITVISGYADAICDGRVSPEETEHYLLAIQSKTASLMELIDAFHEYSKVEHPAFVLHPERTDLCEYVREYLAEKYDEIELAGFGLQVSIPEEPAFCRLDGFEFRRVLDNLLSNSLRHNRLGTLLFFDVLPGRDRVTLRVADNGSGIPADRAAAIFEPFVVGSDARSGSGSGLGLAITRRIVEQHGGTIALSTAPTPGRSTEFVVTLPVCRES